MFLLSLRFIIKAVISRDEDFNPNAQALQYLFGRDIFTPAVHGRLPVAGTEAQHNTAVWRTFHSHRDAQNRLAWLSLHDAVSGRTIRLDEAFVLVLKDQIPYARPR